MKIITVNLPVNYLKVIENLIGEKGLYRSRSELIRVALKEFLVRELESAQISPNEKLNLQTPEPKLDWGGVKSLNDDLFVRVPMSALAGAETEYKTYRIIKK